MGARKNSVVRERETGVSPIRAPVLSCAHYFQALLRRLRYIVFSFKQTTFKLGDFTNLKALFPADLVVHVKR